MKYRRCAAGLWDDTDPNPHNFSCGEMLQYPNCDGCYYLEEGEIVWEKRIEEELEK